MSRRRFMASTAAASLSTLAIGAGPTKPVGSQRPMAVSSANGLRTVERAIELVKAGHDPLDAAIEGVAIVEADPKDHSVGLGGLPNEDGVVELDAAVMHGPTHGGGSVASLRNIVHPAAVARVVMQRSRHCLLVGEGALRFARAHGFPEVNLLTDEARQIWLHWKETRDPNDDWLPPPDEKVAAFIREALDSAGHRHDPLLGPRHPRRPGLHHHDLGAVVEDPRPRRRFAHPGRRAVPRQRGRLGRLHGRGRAEPAEPLQRDDRRGDASRARPEGRDHGGLQDDRRALHEGPEAAATRMAGSPATSCSTPSPRTASSPAARSTPAPGWPCTTATRPGWSPATPLSTRRRRGSLIDPPGVTSEIGPRILPWGAIRGPSSQRSLMRSSTPSSDAINTGRTRGPHRLAG